MKTPARFRRLWVIVSALALAGLVTAAVTIADEPWADGDGVIPVANNDMNLGSIPCGTETSRDVPIAIRRNGGAGTPTVFKNGSTATVSVLAATGVSASVPAAPDNEITIPSNWGSLANNTTTVETVTGTVKVTPTSSGAGSGSVTFSATGVNSANATFSRDDGMNVSWTAGSCDTTAPTSTASAKNADDSTYTFDSWTNQDVTITLSAQDNTGGSGVKHIRYTTDGSDPTAPGGTVYGSPFTISSEGTTTVKWLAVDNAGNAEAVHSAIVKIDKTKPSVSCGSADGNWHANDVSIACTASDNGSGLADASDASFDLVTNVAAGDETNNASTNSRSVSDNAGNSNTAGPISGNKVDKKGPAITCDTPAPTFALGQSPANVTGTASDGGSGLATSATPGAAADTSSVLGNPKSVSLSATDNVGNQSTKPCAYSVLYGFSGFFQPVDMGGVFNKAKAGSAIPVKWSLDGAPQAGSNTPGDGGAAPVMTSAKSVKITCPYGAAVDTIETLADAANSGLKYDPVADQWVYVWKTSTGLANTCQRLEIALADGTTKTASFQFTK